MSATLFETTLTYPLPSCQRNDKTTVGRPAVVSSKHHLFFGSLLSHHLPKVSVICHQMIVLSCYQGVLKIDKEFAVQKKSKIALSFVKD